jgi:hypothetical protein
MPNIFKLSDSAIGEIRHQIQLGIINETDVVDTLLGLNLEIDPDDEQAISVMPRESTDILKLPLKFSKETIVSVATLLTFSLMTKTNFVDLMRQVRLSHQPNRVLSTTPEYETYFKNVVSMRLALAEDVKKNMQSKLA